MRATEFSVESLICAKKPTYFGGFFGVYVRYVEISL